VLPPNGYHGLHISSYREFLGDTWHDSLVETHVDDSHIHAVVIESAGVHMDSTVLDVGCGEGETACQVARLTGARVRGLTPNPGHLEAARAAAERQGLAGRVRFDLGEAGALPYPDQTFDAVLYFECPSHYPDRVRVFAEACRVLRPEGRLAGADWVLADGAPPDVRAHWGAKIAKAWGIPPLGTVSSYAREKTQAGLVVDTARDLREEWPVLRGFVTDPSMQAQIRSELKQTADPIRRLVMEGALVLGEAAAAGAFTLGRFLARRPPRE
jgi:SAM-dependent methyltransferase